MLFLLETVHEAYEKLLMHWLTSL